MRESNDFMKRILSLLLIAHICVAASFGAAPRFARIFTDHAVLQRDSTIQVWGTGAQAPSDLRVRLGAMEVGATIDADGSWKAQLPPQSANPIGAKLELLENGIPVAVINDVLLGDVWIAAGQSNMQFPVRSMLNALPEAQAWVDSADRPRIRFRRINDPVLKDRTTEALDLSQPDNWTPMTPQSVLQFSAVAAVFAKELEANLDVPIGVIDVSWGGKPIEPFIPREAFSSPLLKRILELADSDSLDPLGKLHGGVIIRNPEGHPGAIFNARMAPLVPYGLRGFIWYQAESNAGRGEDPREYRHKTRALVEGWRARWKKDSLPFYSVQLPSYPPANGWVRMREEQRRSLDIPHTGMAVTIDVRGKGIHPPDKIAVGERLAFLALTETHGRTNTASSGPIYRSHEIAEREVRVEFAHADGGLMVGDKPGMAPARPTPDAPLRWFELAGADGVWHSAQATIKGARVIVISKVVANPIAVRYACHTAPQGGNLYNHAGLPASPFCSHLGMLPWIDPEQK